MVKIKEVGKTEEDNEDESLEDEFDEIGIFDEDLASEEVGDFSIGSTILSSGKGEQIWTNENLERTIQKEKFDRNWEADDKFISDNICDSSNEKVHDSLEKYSEDDKGMGVYSGTNELYKGN